MQRFDRLAKLVARARFGRAARRERDTAADPSGRGPGFDFDDLARDLAQGVPRRELLRRVG